MILGELGLLQRIGHAKSLPLAYLFTVGGEGYASNLRRHVYGSLSTDFTT